MNDPKYIDKRPLRLKKLEAAGRMYTARIAHAEDVFFAGRDTPARRREFDIALESADRMLQEDTAQIERLDKTGEIWRMA